MNPKDRLNNINPMLIAGAILDVDQQDRGISHLYSGDKDAERLKVKYPDIMSRLRSLARDEKFVMNYWLKVCKVRAIRGEPMPWENVH